MTTSSMDVCMPIIRGSKTCTNFSSFSKRGDTIVLQNDIKHIVSRSTNFYPLSIAQNDDTVKRYPITEIPDLKIQEGLIIKDILYVLIGLEGNYIRYSKKFDPSFDSITGPNYNITKHLDPSIADIAKRVIKLGKYYYGLSSFVEIFDDEKNGKITQSLCFEIRNLLKDYLSLIIEIEHNFQFNTSYSLRLLGQDLNEKISNKLTHCYELVVYISHENRKRSQHIENHFSNLIQDIKNDLQQTGSIDLHSDSTNSRIVKGGLILKIIEKRLEIVKGDPFSFQLLTALFNNVSRDYIEMLNNWLLKGEVNDPNDEFLIKLNDNTEKSVYTESYWDTKFALRKEGLLKQFADRDMQYKILLTGKYLNILKECGVNVADMATNSIKITSINNNDLYFQIDLAYKRSNQLITDLYFNGLNIRSVFTSLKRFYLLDNIHNFNHFLTLSINELKKGKDLVSVPTLARNFAIAFASEDDIIPTDEEQETRKLIFELLNLTIEPDNMYNYLLQILSVQPIDADEALSSANMSFLKNLLNKTLEVERDTRPTSSTNTKTDNYAINRLNFEISLPFPLNLIITKSFVTQYELIHRHLMIIKFIDQLLESSWKEINFQKFWIYTYRNNKMNKWILKSRILHSKMKDFMKILQFYLSNDVIDATWTDFKRFLENDCNAEDSNFELEKVYSNLQSFINIIFTNSFLTLETLINLINRLFSIIILYSNFLNSLRKTLVLLDENLFNEYEFKMSNKNFDSDKNSERFNKLNNVLSNYSENFNEVLKEFNNGLRYHGETECFAFLQLSEKLEFSGLV